MLDFNCANPPFTITGPRLFGSHLEGQGSTLFVATKDFSYRLCTAIKEVMGSLSFLRHGLRNKPMYETTWDLNKPCDRILANNMDIVYTMRDVQNGSRFTVSTMDTNAHDFYMKIYANAYRNYPDSVHIYSANIMYSACVSWKIQEEEYSLTIREDGRVLVDLKFPELDILSAAIESQVHAWVINDLGLLLSEQD